MITPAKCTIVYGDPNPEFERKYMGIYTVPDDIHEAIKPLPKRIYMNKDMMQPFENSLIDIFNNGLTEEIKEWGGCFMIRMMRGTNVPSIHSWGIAFDINVSTNQMMQTPTLSPELVKCFTDNGFDWGGYFSPRTDGMHFQLKDV